MRTKFFPSGSDSQFALLNGTMYRYVVACLCLVTAFVARAGVTDIDSAELQRMANSGVPVIDVRTAPEWQETGIVAGSHLLTFFDANGKADPAGWLTKASTIAKPGDPVILICRSGNRSAKVSQFLAEHAGYARIYNVKGGMLAWKAARLPVVSAPSALTMCRANATC